MPWNHTDIKTLPSKVAVDILVLFLKGSDVTWISVATRVSGNVVNEVLRRELKKAAT